MSPASPRGRARLVAARACFIEGALVPGMAAEIGAAGLLALRPLGADETPDLRVEILAPALVDLQVNGAGGTMLNSDTSAAGIAHIVATLRARGTGWCMPTLITCEPERILLAAEAAIEAWGLPGFAGLHIEGPHLNPARKGTHRAAFIRPMDAVTLEALARLRAAGVPVMLTLAPEMVPPETIARIAAMGVVVSGGHSAATGAETRAALAAGLGCFTHLYNAMPPMTSREPGILGTAIASRAHAGIIADGHHVSWEMLGIAWRARPEKGRMFLVSDAMSTIGGPDHFELYGERIEVRDGALVNAAGSLAGAHVDMVQCLANLVTHVGIDRAEALAAAITVPAGLIGLAPPALRPGAALAEILALDADLRRIAL